jgi:hypothetical protein
MKTNSTARKNCFGYVSIFEKTNYTLTYSKEELQSIKIILKASTSKLHSYIQKTLKKMLVAIPFYICLPMHLRELKFCQYKILRSGNLIFRVVYFKYQPFSGFKRLRNGNWKTI